MEEIWKDVKGFEGIYQVSNMGRVKSLRRNIILKNRIERNGYERVVLRTNNNPKDYYIHRLVATAFIPNPNNLPQVNHKDENKLNNCVDNLEWCTREYNSSYGTRNERISKTHKKKKVSQYTLDGTLIKTYEGMNIAAKATHSRISQISRCCKNQRKSHNGFIWKYA